MDYTHKAIPTKYQGRIYRSRLEARWAVYFDLANISFEYEPFDLNGWIPDFILNGETLVEIKPIDIKKALKEIVLIGDCRELLLYEKSNIFKKVLNFYLSSTDPKSKNKINLIPREYDCLLLGITSCGYRFKNFREKINCDLFREDLSWFVNLLHTRERNGLNPLIIEKEITYYAGQSFLVEMNEEKWQEAGNPVMYKPKRK